MPDCLRARPLDLAHDRQRVALVALEDAPQVAEDRPGQSDLERLHLGLEDRGALGDDGLFGLPVDQLGLVARIEIGEDGAPFSCRLGNLLGARERRQRGILELRFPYTGKYMFHAHKTEFAELGWMGFFEVEE